MLMLMPATLFLRRSRQMACAGRPPITPAGELLRAMTHDERGRPGFDIDARLKARYFARDFLAFIAARSRRAFKIKDIDAS